MKIVTFAIAISLTLGASASSTDTSYEPGPDHPYGRPNPDAPSELGQFAFMVGNNDCTEERRSPTGDAWTTETRTWDARYTMNGFAIIDTGRSGTSSNGNLRAFDTATGLWQATFFSMPTYSSGVWSGGKEGANIVLKRSQPAPGSNLPGNSRLTFSNISTGSFDWIGEWVSEDGSIVFPFWKISCQRSTTRR